MTPELLLELARCCARVLAFAGDSDLVFVGRSPESLFDLLSGFLEGTSRAGRASLLNSPFSCCRVGARPMTAYVDYPPAGPREERQETGFGLPFMKWPTLSSASSRSPRASRSDRRLGSREVRHPFVRALTGERGSPAHAWSRGVGAPSRQRLSCGGPGSPRAHPPIEPCASRRPRGHAEIPDGRGLRRGRRRAGRGSDPCGFVLGAIA
jgi:hypothetical protein